MSNYKIKGSMLGKREKLMSSLKLSDNEVNRESPILIEYLKNSSKSDVKKAVC